MRRKLTQAFPAYAGMFLLSLLVRLLFHRFPRVCGDVSSYLTAAFDEGMLSPRMRGCFHASRRRLFSSRAFPAYAGMFLIPKRLILNIRSFPRVCGDVSETIISINISHVLSPRMRGCFYQPAQ